MGFFGIVNGRGCYCTPYFTPMESDSSQCDSVCEGDNTLMCGGKSKSSVFAMHMCASTEEDLGGRSDTASSLKSDMDAKVKTAKGLSKDMQGLAEDLQKIFGAVGDSGASGVAQDAKVFAGELEHKAEDAEAAADKLGALAKDASALKDFTDPATVTKAERIMEGIDESVAAGEAAVGNLFCLLVSYYGILQLNKNLFFIIGLSILASLLLIKRGFSYVTSKANILNLQSVETNGNGILFGLYLSIANPIAFVFWSGIMANSANSLDAGLAFNLLIIVGVLVWGLVFSLILSFGKNCINTQNLLYVNKVAGLIMVYYGVKFLWNNLSKIIF
jgi:threonine/homoserine/homoserine lactone efflux protein